MDQLVSLKVFKRLVDTGSFTCAASQLGMAASTASTHIAHLEAHWGVRLLNRNTRKVSLTDEGRALYDCANRMLEEFEELKDQFDGRGGRLTGRLRVGAPPLTASLILIPALTKFYRKYPELEVEFPCSTHFADLVQDGMDCAVRVGTLPDSTLISRPLGYCNLATCASPFYLAEHGEPRIPEDIQQHACITTLSSSTGRVREWLFESNGSRSAIVATGRLTFSTYEASADACAMGMGITQVVDLAAREHLDQGRLKLILTDCIAVGPPIQIVFPRSRIVSPKTRAFVDFVLETVPAYLLSDQTASHRCVRA